MKNQQLTRRAIVAHFACNRWTLQCDPKLEFYTSVANDFLKFFSTGETTKSLERALSHKRYRIKKELIERYIRNYENTN